MYTNKVKGEQFTVTDQMGCQTTGIVYLITCAEPKCHLHSTLYSILGSLFILLTRGFWNTCH